MTQEHPVTPPPDLRWLWAQQAQRIDLHDPVAWMQYVSEKAAQWGADQELEACCKMLYDRYDRVRHATGFPGSDMSDWLRAARRPKPPSLKEQALDDLYIAFDTGCFSERQAETIRRALEQLSD